LQLGIKISLKDHRSNSGKPLPDILDTVALDGEHALLQFNGCTTIFDGQEIGSCVIHPNPGRSRRHAIHCGFYKADLLIKPANQSLTPLHNRVIIGGLFGSDKLQFHNHISLLM
jgi:hypothetical protein